MIGNSMNSHLVAFVKALDQLGLVASNLSPEVENLGLSFVDNSQLNSCWFRKALHFHQHSNDKPLTPKCVALFKSFVAAGLTLRSHWPRSWHTSVEAWIGARFYFSTSANLHPATHFASIVSSQIGRHGSRLPNWPRLADAALQQAQLHRDRPLIVHGTSLSQAVEQFSQRAGLDYVQLQTSTADSANSNEVHSSAVEHWLAMLITEMQTAANSTALDHFTANLKNQIRLSPALHTNSDCSAMSASPSGAERLDEQMEKLRSAPLQDRLAFSLADRVQVLHVRRSGTIEKLLNARLNDKLYPVASVFIASLYGDRVGNTAFNLDLQKWLDKGAVGWLLPEVRTAVTIPVCQHLCQHRRSRESPYVQSLYAPMPRWWQSVTDNAWHYLVHCTRGGTGPLPNESLECYWDRIWRQGSATDSSPYETLVQILSDGKLLANTKLTRTDQPCISFSQVPLVQLLDRRRFRSHLGRWDWEPFGLMIRRDALESFGARPVAYGTEQDFRQLPDDDKPFFQPLGKTPSNDWSVECEWRLLGDLHLNQLPLDAVTVFVDNLQQAQRIARCSQWPVFFRH